MKEFKINAQNKTPREINRTLKEKAPENDCIMIENPNAMHYMVAGLSEPVDVVINGSAGYFAATMITEPGFISLETPAGSRQTT